MAIVQTITDFILIGGLFVMATMTLAPIFLSKYMEKDKND